MDKNELYKLLSKREKQIEAAKAKRTIITTAGFTLAYFCLFCLDGMPTGWDIVGTVVASLFVAGLHFGINAIVFEQLISIGEAERKELEAIRKRISDFEKQEFEHRAAEAKQKTTPDNE